MQRFLIKQPLITENKWLWITLALSDGGFQKSYFLAFENKAVGFSYRVEIVGELENGDAKAVIVFLSEEFRLGQDG